MVTTSTLMENLRQEGVSPDLLLAVNEYRTTHPLTEALAPRVPQSAFTYYGKDVWEQALAALRLIRRGVPAGAALDMGITNKAFDSYEQGLIRDVIAARIPAQLTAAKLFN